MKSYNIAVIPGMYRTRGHPGGHQGPGGCIFAVQLCFNFHQYDFGGTLYLRTGEILPDGAIDELRNLMLSISVP